MSRDNCKDASVSKRLAYADPPYPGKAHLYPENTEIDQRRGSEPVNGKDAAISGRSRIRTGAKGVAGEREVADIFQTAGFDVRGLESSGDWLVVQKDGRVIHVEVKRHERPQWGEWVKQAERDCPQGVPLMVANRRNRQPWYVMQRLEYVVEREARIAELEEGARNGN